MAKQPTTKYVVETDRAVKAVDRLSKTYNANAQSLGILTKEFAVATRAGKNVTTAFTQINAAGQAVTTTINKNKEGITNYSVAVQKATEKQIRFAEQQRALNAAIAQAKQDFKPLSLNAGNKDELDKRFANRTGSLREALRQFNADQLKISKGNAALGLLVDTKATTNLSAGLKDAQISAQNLKDKLRDVGGEFERIKNIGIATAVYRSLSLVGQGFKQSVGDAAEYEKKLVLIRTLSEESGISTQKWSQEIKSLANELGSPIVDVATATYEGLSAQVINTTDDFNVLRAAIKLAKLTESDVVTTTNLLASSINGFKKSTSEAESIASAFLETVDIGNVKVGELGSTLGRAGALAELTGSSLNEVLASIAVLTQSGIDSAESITLLNNVFIQLTKPSELLKQKLRELNFQTGEQAVTTLSLIGTLRALSGVAKDVPNGLAGLFPDIRGLRGAQGLISDATKYDTALKRIENSVGRVNRQFADLQKNNGDRFFSELERIKTFFTVDVGQKFLDAVINVTDKVGGLSNAVRILTQGVVVGTAAFLTFKAISLTATIGQVFTLADKFLLLSRTITATGAAFNLFGPSGVTTLVALKTTVLPVLAAFAAGYLTVEAAIKKTQLAQSEADKAAIESARKVSEARVEAANKANVKILQDFDKNLEAQRSKLGQFVSKETAIMLDALRANQKNGKLIADSLNNSFDVALSVLRKNVSQTEALYEKSNDAIEKIREVQAKTAIERAEQFFDRNIKFAELERDRFIAATGNKQKAYKDYISKISAIAEQRIAFTQDRQVKAINANDISLAEQLNSEIRSILTTLQDETIEINGFTQPLLDQQAIQNRISAEADRFNKLLADRVPQLEKESAAQGKIAFQEKARAKQIEDLLNNTAKFSENTVKNGVIDEKFAGDPQKAIEELKQLQAEALKSISVIDGLKNNQTLENLGVSKGEIQKQFAEQIANLQKEINLSQQANGLRQLTDAQREYGEVARTTLTKVNEKIVEQTRLLEANRVQVLQGIKALQTGFGNVASRTQSDALINAKLGGAGARIDQALQKGDIEAATNSLREFKTILNEITPGLQNFRTKDPLNLDKTVGAKDAVQSLDALFANIKAIQSDQLDKLQQTANSLSNVDPTNFRSIQDSLANIFQQSQNFKGIGGLDTSKAKLLEIMGLMESIIRLKGNLPADPTGQPTRLNGSTPVKGFANGGLVDGASFLADFLGGRYKSGTDIIPAMLTRGEFVVREPMAQKYASLLTAIQHDRAPIYRAEGTPTGNTSVGNIYVSLPSGSTPSQIRAFSNALRRGLSQGTINLGRRN